MTARRLLITAALAAWIITGALRDCGADVAINVDHLDHNRLNNDPDNLVPSCLDCNTKRRPEGAQVQRA